jgi:hypothetical protein
LDDARAKVEEIIGPASGTAEAGSPPFTPRAKKVLELSLREALHFGHNYIGTEHLLLGVVREGEGVGAQVLSSLGTDAEELRGVVIGLLGTGGREGQEGPSYGGGWIGSASWRRTSRRVACSFCGRQPPESGRMVTANRVFICEKCVEYWSAELRGEGPQTEPPSAHFYDPEDEQDRGDQT